MTPLFQKILCPIDVEEDSIAALELAGRIAGDTDAALVLLNVVAIPAHATEMPPEVLTPRPIWERTAKLKLDQIAAERIPSTVRCETVTRSGLPAGTIIAAVGELRANLVVMGTHSKCSALGHLLLGSVAERLIRAAVCPVLVVPPYSTIS
jgi:universal stress protein A